LAPQETLKNKSELRTGPADNIWDKIFANEINEAIELTEEAYDKCVEFLLSRRRSVC
jgi:leucyl-tRNA synthetase